MLRILAFLFVCATFVLGPGGESATAHDGYVAEAVFSDVDRTIGAIASATTPHENDCPPNQVYCKAMCAPCQAPLPCDGSGTNSQSILTHLQKQSKPKLTVGERGPFEIYLSLTIVSDNR